MWEASRQLGAPQGQNIVVSVVGAVAGAYALTSAFTLLHSSAHGGLAVSEATLDALAGTLLVVSVLLFGQAQNYAIAPQTWLDWRPAARWNDHELTQVRNLQAADHLLRLHFVGWASRSFNLGLVFVLAALIPAAWRSEHETGGRVVLTSGAALCTLIVILIGIGRPQTIMLRHDADLAEKLRRQGHPRYEIRTNGAGEAVGVRAPRLSLEERDRFFGPLAASTAVDTAATSVRELREMADLQGASELFRGVLAAVQARTDGGYTTVDGYVATVVVAGAAVPAIVLYPGLADPKRGVPCFIAVIELARFLDLSESKVLERIGMLAGERPWSVSTHGRVGYLPSAAAVEALLLLMLEIASADLVSPSV